MSRFWQILFTILVLWFVSYAASSFSKTDFREKIAVIPIQGAIVGQSSVGFTTASSVQSSTIVQFIKEAQADDSVKGILLEINSPGGTVVASKEIVQAVKNSEKPVVAYIREIGTSGAYWVASASDHIVADELSLTGSIGVISTFLEFSRLIEDYGVTYEGLKTGKYKDVGSRDLALNRTKELANIEDAVEVEFKQTSYLGDILGKLSAYSFYHIGLGIGKSLQMISLEEKNRPFVL